MAPVVLLPAAGLVAVAGGALAQVSQMSDGPVGSWTEIGAIGLIMLAFGMILRAVVSGDFGHLRAKEREEELADIARRYDEAMARAHEREALLHELVVEHRGNGHGHGGSIGP